MESRSSTARDAFHGGGCQLHLNGQLRRPAWSTSYGAYGFSLAGADGGISWQPAQRSSSSYTCGYCKREFRSAQALGGHMNVHRRERARLRHYYCSSTSSPNSTGTTPRPPASSPLPNLNFSPPGYGVGASTADDCPAIYYSFFSIAGGSTTSTTKAAAALEPVNLELGVGEFGSDGAGLDLELRLGC